MSLYNEIADTLSRRGLTGSIISGASSATRSIGDEAAEMMGGGNLAKAIGTIGGAMARNVVIDEVNRNIPIQAQRGLNVGAGAVGDIARGDVNGAGLRVLNSGLLNDILPGMSSVASQVLYWNTPNPLMGGITPTEAKRIYDDMQRVDFSKKNLFLLEVESYLQGNVSTLFNMFATEIDYVPMIITGDKRKVGSAVLDSVQGSEPVELRLTTMDNRYGEIKLWYAAQHSATAAQDGTVGLPSQYAIRFKIVHAFISRESNFGGFEDKGWFRPSNLEVNLSRREDALQEIQITFSQIDTFIRA